MAGVIDRFRIWAAPTELRGIDTAAYPVPPSATNSAIQPTRLLRRWAITRCTRACLSDDGTEVETHEHLGLQLDPTVPPGPEGPGGSGVDVVAAETGAVVTARAVSAVGTLELSDDPVLVPLAWTPRTDASLLLAGARWLDDEDGCRRVSWRA